jgi:hypothetical protein
MNKLLILSIVIIASLSSCSKGNYTCTCVTAATGYPSVTEIKQLHETKSQAKTTCNSSNYTSATGDETINCTFNN